MVHSLAAIICFTLVSLILKSEMTPFLATNIYSNILKRRYYRLQLLWLFQYKMIHLVQSGFQRANSGNLDRLTYIRGVDYTPKVSSYMVISCFGESMSKSSYNNQYQQVLTQGTCLGVGLRAFKCILGSKDITWIKLLLVQFLPLNRDLHPAYPPTLKSVLISW